jgi:hypothetical protein
MAAREGRCNEGRISNCGAYRGCSALGNYVDPKSEFGAEHLMYAGNKLGLGACGDCLNYDSSGTYCVETDTTGCTLAPGVVGPPVLPPATPTCPTGQVYSTSGCVVDPALASLPAMMAAAAASLTPTTGQTFGQWVTANSTLLLVAFGAVGALVALTRVGKR